MLMAFLVLYRSSKYFRAVQASLGSDSVLWLFQLTLKEEDEQAGRAGRASDDVRI
jgi:hypothetical protein